MEEGVEALHLIRTCLTTSNVRTRRHALNKLVQLPSDELPATFPLALVGRASSFSDVPSLRLCAKLIRTCATQNPAAFQKRIFQLTKSFRRSSPSVRSALNQCRLIAPLFAVDGLSDSVLTLFVAAVAGIEGSASRKRGSQRRAQDRARRAAYRIAAKGILVNKNQIISSLMSTGEAFSSNRAEAIAALGVITAIRPDIAAEPSDTAKRFLTALGNVALKAKPAAAHDVVRAVATSLGRVTSEVANAYLVPTLERALVREPEAAVSALLPILLALKHSDLSQFVTKSVTPALLVAMKSSNEKTREDGVNLAITLAFRVKSESALEESVKQLCTLFKSAKYAYQRTAAAQSLKRILCARSEPSFGEVAKLSAVAIETALQSIVNWLGNKKETSADARSEGCQALLILLSAAGGLANFSVVQKSVACKEAANLLCTFLTGGKSKDEEKSALLAFSSQLERVPSLSLLVDLDTAFKHLSILGVGVGRAKQEDAVRALAIIASFAKSDDAFTSTVKASDLWLAIAKKEKSQLAIVPTNLSSEIDAKCVLVACEWLVSLSHPSSELYLSTIFKLATDERYVVSRFARECIRRLRKTGDEEMAKQILDSLWNTHFALAGAVHVPSSPYDFEDNGIHAELLGAALFAAVLPKVPLSCVPKVLLASHYPRLIRENPSAERIKASRWWKLCYRALPSRMEVEDESSWVWLKPCLEEIVGEQGLKSGNSILIETAVNALGGLGKHFSESDFVFRLGLPMLQPLIQAAPQLSKESLDAVRYTQHAKTAEKNLAEFNANLLATKGKKALKRAGNGHVDQRKQAELDKSRAMETAAKAAIEKAEAVKLIAEEAMRSFLYTSAALRGIRSLSISDSSSTAMRIPAILALVMPCCKYRDLHIECRQALFAIARSGDRLLRGMALELSCALFGLAEGTVNMNDRVASIIGALSRSVPPAFDSENFALFAPVLKAALLRDPDLEDQSISSGGQGSTKRRDAVAVVRSAAQILLEHCKPEAVDAAVAAAGARAGTWAITVMEREDGAFAAAADSLASLTGTALTPGTELLSQVLGGVISGKSSVRDGALAALGRIPQLAMPNVECPRDSALGRTLWLARFDPDESNAELASELWKNYNHPLHVAEDAPSMLELLSHNELDVRTMAACGIANVLLGEEKAAVRNICIPQMFSIYLRKLHDREAEEQEAELNSKRAVHRGRDKATTEVEFDAGWVGRHGVALTIEKLAETDALLLKDITIVFAFLSGRGLGDPHDKVRAKMSSAATAVVNAAGSAGPTVILPMIERQLNTPPASASSKQEIAHADRTRENLVMCLGTLAGYLPAADPRVPKTADQVIRCAVETPSELVQNAAARCLVPLARLSFSQERESSVRDDLIKKIWDPQSSYGERRGACYALAGLCRGLGLKAMKRMRIVDELEAAVIDKSPRKRLGAFLIIETHAILLGRLFEPFTVSSLPHLLMCMGDTVVEVRNACWAAAQAAVSEMSSQGVKMILPTLLSGLQERQWRTRAGAAEVLGAMAFCAPRQLAQCLPQVVPKLAEALADAHTRVVASAESAINRIAAVVRSPEVRNLSPFLLAALKDPAGRTRGAVDAMLGTEFVHAIDPASLALLIPPLHRGLRDRSTELKKRAAAIVGSMCNNVSNQTDVSPYLHLLLPDLRTTLLDAIPDVRKTSARAIGALAVALGEDGLPDIVSWLMNALLGTGKPSHVSRDTGYVGAVISSSSAERSGAAMGLAEVSASLSEKRLEEVLQHVMTAGHTNAESREGGLMLVACMPRALGERFESRLALALSSILKGLSDDSDNVREAALEAGRNLVQAYAKSSLEHLLPELMSAMKDTLWRIRQAAARLLGDFLLVIAGARPSRSDVFGVAEPVADDGVEGNEDGENEEDKKEGENEGSEDEDEEQYESPEAAAAAMTTEATMKAIEEVLGWDRRNEVLAALFIIRCDVSIRVRQMGMQVWKTVVSNTPRVLREIMPTAVRQVVDGLGDEDPERRAAAGKALGDLSLKLGDRVVPEVLPALRAGITDEDASPRVRRGACEGLVELVEACPRHQLVEYASDLVAVVYEALCDRMSEVRATAAGVFSSLLTPLGDVAVDAVVPLLIEKISGVGGSDTPSTDDDANRALDALKQILRASGNRLMSIVVPRLTEEVPLSLTSARALAAAAQVAESAFEEHVGVAIEAIIGTLEAPVTRELESALEDISCAVVVASETSSRTLMDVVCRAFNEGSPWRRAAASRVCGCVCRGAPEEEVAKLASSLYEVLIRQLGDPDEDTVMASWQALLDLSTNVPLSELSTHITTIRQSLRSVAAGAAVGNDSTLVAGLQLPKAPAPFVPVFCEGLLRGAPEVRERSALGLADLVEITNVTSLKPFVVKMVGPLIRVMSERFPWQVKAAILRAMTVILEKCAPMLRAFAPQLQSTFLKCLSDGSQMVRVRACAALGCLIPIQMRLEPLLNDLVTLGANGVTAESRGAAFHACSQVYKHGKKLPESAFSRFAHSISEGILDEESEVAKAAGRALGQVASRSRDPNEYAATLELAKKQLEQQGVEYSVRVYALDAVGSVFLGGEKVDSIEFAHIAETVELIQVLMTCVTPPVQSAACMAGARAVSLLVRAPGLAQTHDAAEHRRSLVAHISGRAEFDDIAQVRVAALQALAVVVTVDKGAVGICAPALVVCSAATNTAIRGAGERVMRKAFVDPKDLSVRSSVVQIAKDALSEDDQVFIDRRIPRLRVASDSDDEGGGS